MWDRENGSARTERAKPSRDDGYGLEECGLFFRGSWENFGWSPVV
jgi:hypothetical protein